MICIAGKNEIAVFGVKLLISKSINNKDIVVLTNKNDKGVAHKWQPSFKKYCNDNGIKEVELEDLYEINDLIFISLEYDRIIKTDLFRTKQLFNIHFSLLPAYKGMLTSVHPILRGEKKSGVTLHEIDNGIDTGFIIDQIEFDTPFGTTGLELYNSYIKYSEELLKKNIDSIINNKCKSKPQTLVNASYFSNKTIDFKSLKINFYKTCFEVCNYVNAFSFRPYQLLSYQNVKISKATPGHIKSVNKPGTLILENDLFFEISTIDYNVNLLKDNLENILDKASKNDLESIKKYFDLGFNLNDKNDKGWNVLIVASFNGAYDVVKFLLENNISNVNDSNNKETSVLMYAMTNASKTGNLSILEYLLHKGADYKHFDLNGFDIFHYATEYKNQPVINFLSNYK